MANKKHLDILEQGVSVWNEWRDRNPRTVPDLSGAELGKMPLTCAKFMKVKFNRARFMEADLMRADLRGSDLRSADLRAADLSGADLREADLDGAELAWASFKGAQLGGMDLRRASFTQPGGGKFMNNLNFTEADLHGVDLSGCHLNNLKFNGADLTRANLNEAFLYGSDFTRATLTGASLVRANLIGAILIETNLEQADLSGCRVFGVSAWGVRLQGAVQSSLIITPWKEPATIEVDNLEVAQFIYLLLNNEKVRDVIDTITSKVVLILGRFTDKRKAVLDAVREELRRRNFTPVLFDFDKPMSKDVTGTVETLARMARFIVADLTDPSSIPHELATIVPFLRTTPVLPLKLVGSGAYTMFDDLQRAYKWVLRTHEYEDERSLIVELPGIIEPADKMADEFRSLR